MSQKLGNKAGAKKTYPWWKRVRSKNNLAHGTMGPDGMHMLVLSELAVAIPRPLATTTFQQSR